jgi:hypothetical protein
MKVINIVIANPGGSEMKIETLGATNTKANPHIMKAIEEIKEFQSKHYGR